MHLVFFASQSYIDTYGTPKSVAELRHHRLVIQADDRPVARQWYDQLFPGMQPESFVSVRTNVSSQNYWSILKGAGIGALPTYASAIGAPIIPLDLDVHLPIDIWMTYHPGAARIPRVRRLAKWLISVFSPKVFPWFRDEFIPPAELAAHYRGRRPDNPFIGLEGVTRNDR
jgi:DNA-binding transcriptional LysR family regulator